MCDVFSDYKNYFLRMSKRQGQEQNFVLSSRFKVVIRKSHTWPSPPHPLDDAFQHSKMVMQIQDGFLRLLHAHTSEVVFIAYIQ